MQCRESTGPGPLEGWSDHHGLPAVWCLEVRGDGDHCSALSGHRRGQSWRSLIGSEHSRLFLPGGIRFGENTWSKGGDTVARKVQGPQTGLTLAPVAEDEQPPKHSNVHRIDILLLRKSSPQRAGESLAVLAEWSLPRALYWLVIVHCQIVVHLSLTRLDRENDAITVDF